MAEPDRAFWTKRFDLFAALEATEEQLEFPVLYASGRTRLVRPTSWKTRATDMAPLFDQIIEHVPAHANVDSVDEPFRMLATTIEADPFIGPHSDRPYRVGHLDSQHGDQSLWRMARQRSGKRSARRRFSRSAGWRASRLRRHEAGDIVAIAGLTKATVADTLCAPEVTTALKAQPIDPPTITVTFGINDSPLAGRDGKKSQSASSANADERIRSQRRDQDRRDPGGDAFEGPAAANCRWAC